MNDSAQWFCDKCKGCGKVEFESGEGVYQVFTLIGDDHKQTSPDCENEVTGLQILG